MVSGISSAAPEAAVCFLNGTNRGSRLTPCRCHQTPKHRPRGPSPLGDGLDCGPNWGEGPGPNLAATQAALRFALTCKKVRTRPTCSQGVAGRGKGGVGCHLDQTDPHQLHRTTFMMNFQKYTRFPPDSSFKLYFNLLHSGGTQFEFQVKFQFVSFGEEWEGKFCFFCQASVLSTFSVCMSHRIAYPFQHHISYQCQCRMSFPSTDGLQRCLESATVNKWPGC